MMHTCCFGLLTRIFCLFFWGLAALHCSLEAQPAKVNKQACEPTRNKQAERMFAQVEKQKEEGFKRKMLREILEVEPDYYEVLYLLGRKTYAVKQHDEALRCFTRVAELCAQYSPYTYYFIGKVQLERDRPAEALVAFKKFMAFEDGISDKEYEEVKMLMPGLANDASLMGNPVPFDPMPVMDVCSKSDEYSASLSPDNRYIYFTRKSLVQSSGNDRPFGGQPGMVELFMRSGREKDRWAAGEIMDRPFNQGSNNGAAAITADNKRMYFVVCEGNIADNCDLWFSEWQGYRWSPLQSMGTVINSRHWDSHPTISYDGNTLIFASDRPGGFGKADLYMSIRTKDGSWSEPENLGPEINTSENEITPFIHTDSQTLYFSSKGHKGLGGYDIFYTRKSDEGKWSKPKNIGYPINTRADELSFFVSLDGKTGFFCTSQLITPEGKNLGVGGYDLFSFNLYEEARPDAILFIEGQLSQTSGTPVGGILEIREEGTQKITHIEADSADGKFVAVVSAKNNHIISVNQEGLAFTSARIVTDSNLTGTPMAYALQTEEIKVGVGYRLNDVNFATNSSELGRDALEIIRDFASWLEKNPGVHVSIEGHTDNIGQADANLMLSKQRAESVYKSLIEFGIMSSRLLFKGFGSTRPLASNATETGRFKNRRTEFVILEK
jgi:outer membrane protein OmpA-like peptidoglycan-associated protein/tetratricopeptide (TPR) repeat protein